MEHVRYREFASPSCTDNLSADALNQEFKSERCSYESGRETAKPSIRNRPMQPQTGRIRVTRIALGALPVLLLVGQCHAQNIVGDWLGTVQLGSAETRIQLHIAKGTKGGYTLTLDDIDHGQNGVVASSLSFTDSKLSFVADALSVSYEGKVDAAGTAIDGTWSQGFALPVTFRRLTAPMKLSHKPAKPSDIDGTWEGRIDATDGARLVFHLINTEDGLTATVDSPDQNLLGWPVPVVTRTDSTLRLEVKQVSAAFEGKISSDLGTIDGSWGSGGKEWPLVLKRVKESK